MLGVGLVTIRPGSCSRNSQPSGKTKQITNGPLVGRFHLATSKSLESDQCGHQLKGEENGAQKPQRMTAQALSGNNQQPGWRGEAQDRKLQKNAKQMREPGSIFMLGPLISLTSAGTGQDRVPLRALLSSSGY